jgi:hypothetical protein
MLLPFHTTRHAYEIIVTEKKFENGRKLRNERGGRSKT